MFAEQLPWLPPSASTFATDWEQIFWYINVVTAAAGLLVYAMIVYFCFAFARGDGGPRQTPRILGSTRLEIAWTLVPLFFFLTFFVWGVKVYNHALQVPADGQPIVLLNDRQTIGGYPRLGALTPLSVARLAQCLPGTRLRLTPVGLDIAQRQHRRWLGAT